MHKQIDVNLAVDNLEGSTALFSAAGFNFDAQFPHEQAACRIHGDNSDATLPVKTRFSSFTRKLLGLPQESAELPVGLSCESQAEADTLVAKALACDGSVPRVSQGFGFMDGHGCLYLGVDPHGPKRARSGSPGRLTQ